MRLVRVLAGLGYGSRSEVEALLRRGRVLDAQGHALAASAEDPGGELFVDGQALDPRPPLVLLLHKPVGYVCTRAEDEGPTVYELLPPRFASRRPILATVGRLDKETSGFLLLTDDGALLHRLTSPRQHLTRHYRVELADPLRGDEAEALRSGTLMLRGEDKPLRPAQVVELGPTRLRVSVTEGRYHLVRRAFGALGHRVASLHREGMGAAGLDELPEGEWRVFDPARLR